MASKTQLEWQLDTLYKRREKYKSIVKNCNRRLKNTELKLKKVKKHEEKFKLVTFKIEEFFGEKIPKAEKIYRDLYCKYCLENGVKSEFIAKYLKYNRVKTVYDRRKIALQYLKKEENKVLWKNLQVHLKM